MRYNTEAKEVKEHMKGLVARMASLDLDCQDGVLGDLESTTPVINSLNKRPTSDMQTIAILSSRLRHRHELPPSL